MPATLNSDNLRRWAMQCEDQANDPRASGYKRARFMMMRESLLLLAAEEDFSKRAKRMPELNNDEILSLAERMTGIPPIAPKEPVKAPSKDDRGTSPSGSSPG